jgi:hypothetical protein
VRPVRGHVSTVDLREHVAGANSAADSGQLSLGGGSRPASRVVAPQAKASKSSQPAVYADAEPFVLDRADLVRARFHSTLLLATLTLGLSLAGV